MLVAAHLWLPATLRAEPYLALRTGLKCSQCHVNRTGGGGRNAFGSAWAQTMLPMRTSAVRSRSLNDWISIGADLRALVRARARRPASSPRLPRTALEMSEAQLQVEARFVPNRLALYVDETLGPGQALAREAFVLVEALPAAGYAKAGKFLLPYGWRLWDDEAAIRSETRFTYAAPDIGLEIGAEPGPLSWSVAVTNGTGAAAEDDDGKMVTSSAALVFPRFRIGASGSRNTVGAGSRKVFGGFGGFAVGGLAVLAEADWIMDGIDQFVAYAEGDFLIRKGWNVKLAYGYHDPDVDVAQDQGTRLRAGLEAFPVSFVQLSGYYVRFDRPGRPDDEDRLSIEVHLHF